MAGKGYNYADDFDDDWYDDEEEYYEEEDDAEDPELAAAVEAAKKFSLAGKSGQAAKPGTKPAPANRAQTENSAALPNSGPGAAANICGSSKSSKGVPAGGSALASILCRPGQQPQQSSSAGETFPIAPQAAQQQAGAFKFDTPSPDDAVLSARSKPAAVAAASTPPPSRTPTQSVTSRLGVLQVQAAAEPETADEAESRPLSHAKASTSGQPYNSSRPPKRPLREYEAEPDLARAVQAAMSRETSGQAGKPLLHLVVLGHVDAGKSTLMGRLLHDLGHVSQKAAHKAERDARAAGKGSFAWAWLLDEREEERARGVTVDVAATFFETPARLVRLLDAPGHQDFVPNMIAGAAQADAALLVVDGSVGGFEAGFGGNGAAAGGGQTREHAQLARSLGIDQLAVVISKLDTCCFSQERFEEVKSVLAPFLKVSGFRESQITWLPAVGPSGVNLIGPPTEPALAQWWQGPTLVQAIDSFKPSARDVHKPLRLPVTDVFKSARGGAALGGRLAGGALKAGTRVLLQPGNHAGTVKSVEMNGAAVEIALAGYTANVALNGIDTAAVSAGSMLCLPQWPVPLVTCFEARVVVLDVAMPILKGRQVSVHVHVAVEAGQISRLVSVLNPKTGEVMKARPRALSKGQTAVLEITVNRQLCLELYTDFRALGRIAIRDGGRTIAVGVVTSLVES